MGELGPDESRIESLEKENREFQHTLELLTKTHNQDGETIFRLDQKNAELKEEVYSLNQQLKFLRRESASLRAIPLSPLKSVKRHQLNKDSIPIDTDYMVLEKENARLYARLEKWDDAETIYLSPACVKCGVGVIDREWSKDNPWPEDDCWKCGRKVSADTYRRVPEEER